MPPSRHTPDHDASPAEWDAFLAGRGYVRDTEPKPVSNYKSFHGYWVPPRLGSKGSGGVVTRARTRGASSGPDRSWYSKKQLIALYRTDRRTFDKLVERVRDIKELVAAEEAAEALAEHRALLEPAVEAGLLNQEEADRKLAAWATANGIPMPEA